MSLVESTSPDVPNPQILAVSCIWLDFKIRSLNSVQKFQPNYSLVKPI